MTEIDGAVAEAIALALDVGPDPQLTKITHRVYRVAANDQTLVLKLFQPADQHQHQRELDGRRIAATAIGPWTPPLIASGTTPTGHHYVAYSHIAGTSLHTLAQRYRPKALQLLGSILHHLHQATSPYFGPITNPTTTTAHALIRALATERAALLTTHGETTLADTLAALANRLPPSSTAEHHAVLCHGDLHFHNVIVTATHRGDPEVQAIVDYESVTYAFAEYDLAKTLVVCSAFTDQDRRALQAGYGHHTDDTLLTDLLTYHAIDGWLWAALIERRHQRLWRTRLNATLKRTGRGRHQPSA